VKQEEIPSLKEEIFKAFETEFNHPPLFYDVGIDNGVRKVEA
jgi:hypothetical protein